MKYAPHLDFVAMEHALADALARGAVDHPDHQVADDQGMAFLLWGTWLHDVFGPSGGNIVAVLHRAVAEQDLMLGELEARIAALETRAGRPEPNYAHGSIADMLAWIAREMATSVLDIRANDQQDRALTARSAFIWAADQLGHPHDRIARRLGVRKLPEIATSLRRANLRRPHDTAFQALTDRLVATFATSSRP